jgi:hypothetical protein
MELARKLCEPIHILFCVNVAILFLTAEGERRRSEDEIERSRWKRSHAFTSIGKTSIPHLRLEVDVG